MTSETPGENDATEIVLVPHDLSKGEDRAAKSMRAALNSNTGTLVTASSQTSDPGEPQPERQPAPELEPEPPKEEEKSAETSPEEPTDPDPPEQIMITEITNVVKPPAEPPTQSPRRPFSSTSAPEQPPSYTDDEIKAAIDEMMKKKQLPDVTYHQPIRDYINREQLKAALEQNYAYAAKLEDQLQTLISLLQVDDSAALDAQRRKELEEKLANATEQHDTAVKYWTERLDQCRADFDEKINQLEEQQNKEVADFESNWNDPNNLTQFTKPSARLLQLRQIEQRYAIAKLFTRAQEIKTQADQLQREETRAARDKAVAAMKMQFSGIEARQKKEMDCLLQHRKRTIELLELERDKQVKPMAMVVARLHDTLHPKPNRDKVEVAPPAPSRRPIRKNVDIYASTKLPSLDIGAVNTRGVVRRIKTARSRAVRV